MNKNLRRNNTNSKIMNKTNNTNYNTSNINIHLNNNSNSNYHQNKYNLFNLKKDVKDKIPIIKIKDYLTNDDFIVNKNHNNRNSSLYPLVITEESKKKNININIQKNKYI